MTAILELTNIYLKDNEVERLKDINITIKYGEKIALLGKSGSGKTTLLKIANGSLIPNHGTVLYKGTNINKLIQKQRTQIGTFWQDLRLIDELTVGQNINTGALGRHGFVWAIANLIASIERKKCEECLKVVELPKSLLNKNVNKLSFGQKARVSIARLLRQKSTLLLADEPLSCLDPKQSKRLLKKLLQLHEIDFNYIPSTCIISLHQPKYIKYFSRVIGIKDGIKIFDKSADDIDFNLINKLYV